MKIVGLSFVYFFLEKEDVELKIVLLVQKLKKMRNFALAKQPYTKRKERKIKSSCFLLLHSIVKYKWCVHQWNERKKKLGNLVFVFEIYYYYFF